MTLVERFLQMCEKKAAPETEVNMTPRKLIAVNTLASYARTIFVSGLGLFTTRWVLEALGTTDYGLYFAVGGLVTFLSFISVSLSNSASRHFAFAIGEGGVAAVNRWFNAAMIIHLVFGCLFVLLAIPFGVLAFRSLITIPETRLVACRWVYVCSISTVFLNIVVVPFNAMFTATQRIVELTVIQALNTILLFGFAYFLLTVPGDRLVIYAAGIAVIALIIFLLQSGWCLLRYQECRLNLRSGLDKSCILALLSFCGWSLLSVFACVFQRQGSVLVLNNCIAPGANAGLGIANQVSGYAGVFSGSLMAAVSPAIITREGAGDRSGMMRLAVKTCKFTVFLTLFLVIPLVIDGEPLLILWLKTPPPYTYSFIRMTLLALVIGQSTTGVSAALGAYGDIKWPSIVAACCLLPVVPLGWLSLHFRHSPSWIVGWLVIANLGISLTHLVFARRYVHFQVRQWLRESILPCLLAAFTATLVSMSILFLLPNGLLRFCVVGLASGAVLLVMGWLVVLDQSERELVLSRLRV